MLDGAAPTTTQEHPDTGRLSVRSPSILIVEDDCAASSYMTEALRGSFCDLRRAATATDALLAMESRPADLLILDLGLPDMDGLELLTRVRQRWTEARILCVTATDDIPTVVEAVQRGASDYLTKPAPPARLLAAAGQALASPRAAREVVSFDVPEVVGVSKTILMVRHLVVIAGRSDVNVLITGETGTGKELIARAIHRLSGHSPDSFVAFNCATTPPELFDSQFFGHRRGAFTGADRDHVGLLQRANGRTLLLDELETMRSQEQARLLRVLDDGEVRPVGSNEVHHVSVRFLAATNREPGELIRAGLLREDLYYRLCGFSIELPPLRERLEDLPALAAHFLGAGATRLTSKALAELRQYGWPGNVRELRNVLRRASLMAGDGPIGPECLPIPRMAGHPHRGPIPAGTPAGAPTLRDLESQAILRALQEARGHRGRAARALGIDRSTLRRKIREIGTAPGIEGPGT